MPILTATSRYNNRVRSSNKRKRGKTFPSHNKRRRVNTTKSFLPNENATKHVLVQTPPHKSQKKIAVRDSLRRSPSVETKKMVSRYRGVCWNKITQKWRGRVACQGTEYYLGLYNQEVQAAMAANWKCKELGIPLYNPGLPCLAPKPKKQTSQYRGVFFDKTTNRWKAQLYYKRKKFYLGLFHSEERAAEAVNWKCRHFYLPFSNPMLPARRPPMKKKSRPCRDLEKQEMEKGHMNKQGCTDEVGYVDHTTRVKPTRRRRRAKRTERRRYCTYSAFEDEDEDYVPDDCSPEDNTQVAYNEEREYDYSVKPEKCVKYSVKPEECADSYSEEHFTTNNFLESDTDESDIEEVKIERCDMHETYHETCRKPQPDPSANDELKNLEEQIKIEDVDAKFEEYDVVWVPEYSMSGENNSLRMIPTDIIDSLELQPLPSLPLPILEDDDLPGEAATNGEKDFQNISVKFSCTSETEIIGQYARVEVGIQAANDEDIQYLRNQFRENDMGVLFGCHTENGTPFLCCFADTSFCEAEVLFAIDSNFDLDFEATITEVLRHLTVDKIPPQQVEKVINFEMNKFIMNSSADGSQVSEAAEMEPGSPVTHDTENYFFGDFPKTPEEKFDPFV